MPTNKFEYCIQFFKSYDCVRHTSSRAALLIERLLPKNTFMEAICKSLPHSTTVVVGICVCLRQALVLQKLSVGLSGVSFIWAFGTTEYGGIMSERRGC